MLNFAVEVCQVQRRAGRGFLMEHPQAATSWEVEAVKQLIAETDVQTTVLDMCRFGMQAVDRDGPGLVRKSTQVVSDVEELISILSQRCLGAHRHVHLVGGKARAAAIYPEKLCNAVVKGVRLWRVRVRDNFQGAIEFEHPELCDCRNHVDTLDALDGVQIYELSRPDLCDPVSWIQLTPKAASRMISRAVAWTRDWPGPRGWKRWGSF